MDEQKIREKMVIVGRSLFDRGFTSGGSGNMSVRLRDGMLVTPTNSCLGRLEADQISRLDLNGNLISGGRPSKEFLLHSAVFEARPSAFAVIHLHSPYAVAVSCLKGLDPINVLPPITPYFVMRIGSLPLIPYFQPGDPELASVVGKFAAQVPAMLLAHHGTVVAGRDLDDAVFTGEELEETSKLFMLLRKKDYNVLDPDSVRDLLKRSGH